MEARLYVCATPIGNLEDITLRVLRILQEVDLIAAEDTRHTLKLLNHFSIKKPLMSCHEYNESRRSEELLGLWGEGKKVALVSDAGMPGVSDPGIEVVRAAIEAGVPVEVLPGANAALCGLVLSGYDTRRFLFEGFLPPGNRERKARLAALAGREETVVLYEAPHRLERTLRELYETLGDREITLARELTKLHEETVRTTLAQAMASLAEQPARGEYVLVLKERPAKEEEATPEQLQEAARALIAQGVSRKEAAAQVAKQFGAAKNLVYRLTLEE